jgi:hypothetical protein
VVLSCYICVPTYVCMYMHIYRGANKSLARPGRKQAAPVKVCWAEEWIDLARVGTGGGLL